MLSFPLNLFHLYIAKYLSSLLSSLQSMCSLHNITSKIPGKKYYSKLVWSACSLLGSSHPSFIRPLGLVIDILPLHSPMVEA